jgi:hypothetical protein
MTNLLRTRNLSYCLWYAPVVHMLVLEVRQPCSDIVKHCLISMFHVRGHWVKLHESNRDNSHSNSKLQMCHGIV